MKVIKEDTLLKINEKNILFSYRIETILEFPEYCVLLLMDDNIPDNNVVAIDYNGNKVWDISEIVKLTYPECYVALSKESESLFSVTSYNGVKFFIDPANSQVITKKITK